MANTPMSQSDFRKYMADSTGLAQTTIQEVFDALESLIKERTSKGEPVKIGNICQFELVERKQRDFTPLGGGVVPKHKRLKVSMRGRLKDWRP